MAVYIKACIESQFSGVCDFSACVFNPVNWQIRAKGLKKLSVRISTVNEYTLKCPTIPHPPYVYKYAACHHYIHNTTCNCHPSTSIFPPPSFICTTFCPFLPDLRYMDLILGISRTHPLIPPTHTLPHQLESI